MAELIRIKGSDVTSAPPSLATRELAYSEVSGQLFWGRISDGTPVVIGGKADHDKLAGIEAGAEANTVDSVAGKTGAVTLNAADITDFNSSVDGRISAAVLGDLSNVNTTGASDGQVLTYNQSTGNFELQAPSTGVTQFASLNDTPSAFTGAAGFFVRVNATADGLEFVDGIDGGTF